MLVLGRYEGDDHVEPIKAEIKIVQDDNYLAPITQVSGQLAAASEYAKAARILHASGECKTIAADCAAQAIECALKAVLNHVATKQTVLKDPRVRHNIDGLWRMAGAQAIVTPADPPSWVSELSQVHDSPYYVRYPSTHAIVFPNLTVVLDELHEVLSKVHQRISEQSIHSKSIAEGLDAVASTVAPEDNRATSAGAGVINTRV